MWRENGATWILLGLLFPRVIPFELQNYSSCNNAFCNMINSLHLRQEVIHIRIVANLSSVVQEIDESFLKFILSFVSKITGQQLVTERDKGNLFHYTPSPVPTIWQRFLIAIHARLRGHDFSPLFFDCIHAGYVVSISNFGAYTYYTRWVLKNWWEGRGTRQN